MQQHQLVSQQEWLAARKALLAKEKEFTRLRDSLSAARRDLPWVTVDKDYVFEGPDGTETLADLFDGRDQLIVYHFMFGPDWQDGCPSCSLISDTFDDAIVHLNQRNVSMVVVSRAPYAKLKDYEQRMGWHFKWLSSQNSDFNRDFHVSFTEQERESGQAFYNYQSSSFPVDEAPGLSVFFKDEDGQIFHTYSTYGRGLDALIGTYQFLDLVPKGRDEASLDFPMAWVRRHDEYGG